MLTVKEKIPPLSFRGEARIHTLQGFPLGVLWPVLTTAPEQHQHRLLLQNAHQGDATLAVWAPAAVPRMLERMDWVLLIISRLPTPTRGQERLPSPQLSTPILPSLRWWSSELQMNPQTVPALEETDVVS